jgi:hypothetical protein
MPIFQMTTCRVDQSQKLFASCTLRLLFVRSCPSFKSQLAGWIHHRSCSHLAHYVCSSSDRAHLSNHDLTGASITEVVRILHITFALRQIVPIFQITTCRVHPSQKLFASCTLRLLFVRSCPSFKSRLDGCIHHRSWSHLAHYVCSSSDRAHLSNHNLPGGSITEVVRILHITFALRQIVPIFQITTCRVHPSQKLLASCTFPLLFVRWCPSFKSRLAGCIHHKN